MARTFIGYGDKALSHPEGIVLDFLKKHVGQEFTPEELSQELGIQVHFIRKIIDSIIWKGYEIGYEKHRNKAYYIYNTWRSYAAGGAVFGTMIIIILWGFIG